MISRSILALGKVSQHNLVRATTRTQVLAKTLFTSQTVANSANNDDKHIWIEDNLRLDIKESDNETIIDVVPSATGREERMLPAAKSHSSSCALCRLNLINLHYSDVLILAQFIKKNGSIVTYHESKLCGKQYRKVTKLIGEAQRCNLIARPADYLVPGPWHDLNTYLERDRRRDQPMKVIKKEYWRI